ncbi:AAA family ATPase [Nocardia arthritidis]|uniref:AAA family ATPase n=1 Tax=Nocardia arthritidis TaxID=228602 RepID=A0A6G9YHK9_9NOCA|nr:ATP-binding protein [Nocardia arthritidis]QIS12702.1 AAA family ATPase [Nocardia arthritidis]
MGSEAFDADTFAIDLQRIMRSTANAVAGDGRRNTLVAKVVDHLGADMPQVTVVGQNWDSWEHANLQRGVDAYLAERATAPDWFGVAGAHRGHEELAGLVAMARKNDQFELGTVDFTTVAIGPAEVTEAVQLGLITTTAPDGAPVVIGMRGPDMRYGNTQQCMLEILAAQRATAVATRDRIERLMAQRDVFRGQVLAFGVSENRGNDLVTFLPRPRLTADQVVLPDGVLDLIERHTVGIATHGARLLDAGQHLKRGLLLHGAPGTGKTHTVRYLMGRLSESTVIVLTGPAMRLIGRAANLARRLQPSVVVVEDVDLIAKDRSYAPMGNPLLFSLLDAMDGIGGDADVTFLLTTNRVAELEEALAQRPGRVDLAVEIPRPDAEGRAALLQLYSRNLRVEADLTPIVAETAGQTASFIKELLRRAALRAITDRPGAETVVVGANLTDALAEMNSATSTLTRSLLSGGGSESDGAARAR